ncbi:Gfo/Idh/MocA family protein [Fibrella sp. WM1]|uniref:Gfo/Idh/MocA family protein n=1 Tax=Fibrella musci TaxID=3242485 RepID=UPI003520EEC8
MPSSNANRRRFLRESLAATAGLTAFSALDAPAFGHQSVRHETLQPVSIPVTAGRLKFAAVGLNHPHIYGMTEAVLRGGGELVGVYAKEPDLLAAYTKKYPQAKVAKSEDELVGNSQIQLILSAAIPDERAPLGIRVMKAGQDYLADKPGITSLEQLAEVRRVQKETKRIYSISYSEHFDVRATVRAGELVKAGAIGKVIQTIGLGPHRIGLNPRPDWFFDKKRFGGILCDIGAHQCEQFLFFTGSTEAGVVASQVRNVNHPQYPNFQDFGDMMLRGNGGTGYVRLDWFTPNGLSTWGDGRLTILGTDGYIELRKYVDVAGRPNGEHLFLVDQKETRYVDCSQGDLPFGRQLIDDVLNRTETAMTQAHCFLATELALKAQKQASDVKV